MLILSSFDDLKATEGKSLGTSDWVRIGEDRIAGFDQTTAGAWGPVRGAEPGRTTIPDHLLLAMLGRWRGAVVGVTFDFPARMSVFYGYDRVRFLAPVAVGARLRLHLAVAGARMAAPGVIHVVYRHLIELEGRVPPVLEADAINRIHLK